MSDTPALTAWANVAVRLTEIMGRRCYVRLPRAGDCAVVPKEGWAEALLEGAMRLPIDGGGELQGELVVPRGDDAAGADVAIVRPLLGELAEILLRLSAAEHTAEAAVTRERRLDGFGRALVEASTATEVYAIIVEQMARAVGAEIGALALPIPGEDALGVTATFGYPAVVVEHVRQAPGEGILGRVFATGQSVVVRDVSELPDHARRRRYRSSSYLVVPLTGAGGVQAVVAVTDKSDGRPFDERDLAILTGLNAPASLALSREELRARTRDLAHQATVDVLTALFNRRYFETRLEQEIQRQRRQFAEFSLLMVDLDDFKRLNDSQGHLVGDRVLREVADILRRAVRIFDVCARYGGEEFVILMPGANAATAFRIAERIRRQVEQHFVAGTRAGGQVASTVSVGVASAQPATTRETLIAQADSALFQAKARGKNVVCVYP
jgi:diguanylate cyclase (GGDEF)-like protein